MTTAVPPVPIQPENLLDVLTFRIADPGTFVHRKLSISGVPMETVPRWAARAVAAGLKDGTLGYVPVAAQPRYVLDVAGVLDLISQYAEACVQAATTGSPKAKDKALERREEVRHAIRAALTPVPDVEPEPRWGAGPLVEHNPETPVAIGPADVAEYLNPTGAPAALNCPTCGSGDHEYHSGGTR